MDEIVINEELQNLLQPLSTDEYNTLEQSILSDGCRDSIVIWNNIIVDGHHRYKICTEHKISYKTYQINFTDIEEAKAWIDKNQIGKRNLTPDMMRLVRGRIYNRTKKAVGNPHVKGVNLTPLKTADKLAEEFGVSESTIKRDAKFAAEVEADPDLYEAIKNKESVREIKKEKRKEEYKEKIQNTKPVEGKYRIILADPPWYYRDAQDNDKLGGAKKHYDTMTIQELCELKIGDKSVDDIAEDSSVLFLWVTSPKLEESFSVINAWGFEYKTSFVWDKIGHNMGYYNSVRHEFLLICTKGKGTTPDVKKLFDSVQSIQKSRVHSEKPEEFRTIIDTLYTHGNKIELFGRKKVEGWKVWGNEVE